MNMFQQYPQARESEWERRKRMMMEEDAIMRQHQMNMMYGQGASQFDRQMQDPFINRNLGSTNRIANPVSANYSPPGLLYDQPAQQMANYAQNPIMAEQTPSRYEGSAGFAQQQMMEEQMLAQQQQDFQDREILAEYEAAEAQDQPMSQEEIGAYGKIATQALGTLNREDKPPKMIRPPGLLQSNPAFFTSYRSPRQMASRAIPQYNLLG